MSFHITFSKAKEINRKEDFEFAYSDGDFAIFSSFQFIVDRSDIFLFWGYACNILDYGEGSLEGIYSLIKKNGPVWFVDHVHGSFFFFLKKGGEYYLGSDKIGDNWVFYRKSEESLHLSPDLMSIARSCRDSLNHDWLEKYFSGNPGIRNKGPLENSKRLKSGTCFQIKEKTLVELPPGKGKVFEPSSKLDTVFQNVENVIRNNIQSAFEARKNVTLFYSEGMDSLFVLSQIEQLNQKPINLYSYCPTFRRQYTVSPIDSLKSVRSHKIANFCAEEVLKFLDKTSFVLPIHNDWVGEAIAEPLCLRPAVQEGAGIILTGSHADELFGRRPRYISSFVLAFFAKEAGLTEELNRFSKIPWPYKCREAFELAKQIGEKIPKFLNKRGLKYADEMSFDIQPNYLGRFIREHQCSYHSFIESCRLPRAGISWERTLQLKSKVLVFSPFNDFRLWEAVAGLSRDDKLEMMVELDLYRKSIHQIKPGIPIVKKPGIPDIDYPASIDVLDALNIGIEAMKKHNVSCLSYYKEQIQILMNEKLFNMPIIRLLSFSKWYQSLY